MPSCLPIFGKFHPAQNKNPPEFHYKTLNILTESNDNFSHGHFELYIFILAQKLTEKVQLILQLLNPYTIIPTSTVIGEMRVN